MRAIVCRELTGPSALRVENREPSEPTDSEVKIAAHAWGVNFVDVLMTRGGYQLKPELPFVCGLEGAGEVLDVGRTVTEYRPGDRVIYGMRPGAFAEVVTVASTSIIHAPATLDWEQAACFRSAFVTAYHGLVQGGRLAAGEVALIHGATGGMGLAAVQVAKLLGATVIATGGSEAKLDIVKQYGADHVVSYASPHFRETVRDLTGGADVVFDPVGGDVFDESMRCLNWGARIVVVGFTSGRAAEARTNHVLIKGASIVGVRAGEFARRNPEIGRKNLETVAEWAEAGKIQSHISHRFPFENVADAMTAITNREVIGRAVLHR